jgi:protein O-mannosyl-transferase
MKCALAINAAIQKRLGFVGLLIMLLALAAAAYSPGINGPFLLDDEPNITPTALETLSWDEARLKVLSGRFAGVSRSLTNLSFGVTQFCSGYQAPAFKYQNLMLHLANGLLVFWLAALVIRVADEEQGDSFNHYWLALLISAIWLLHPLQVSTVLYAVQRLVILSAFFCMLSAICYVEGRLLMHNQPWLGLGLLLIGLLLFWPLALLSKENAVLLAPALLLIEWLVLRFRATSRIARKITPAVIGIFLLGPVLLGLLYLEMDFQSILAGYVGREFGPFERLLTQIHALGYYIELVFYPVPANMGLFQDDFTVQRELDQNTVIGALGLTGLIVLAILLRRHSPLIALGILWFFSWHMLESTIIPLEMVFEHRNYVALLGLALMFAAFARLLARCFGLHRALTLGIIGLAAVLSLNTAARAYTWGNFYSFAAAEYARKPTSPRAIEAMYVLAHRDGDRAAALFYLKQLEMRLPNDPWPLIVRMIESCREPEKPPYQFEKTLSLATTGLLTPAAVNAVRHLDRKQREGNCPNIPIHETLALAEALAGNHRAHILETRIVAANQWAALAASSGDFDTAKFALQQAFGLSIGSAPHSLHFTSQVAGDIASLLENDDASIAFAQSVTEGFERELAVIDGQVSISRRAYPPF